MTPNSATPDGWPPNGVNEKPMPRLYRLLRATATRAPKANRGVALITGLTIAIAGIALVHVRRRQEVLRLGYELARTSHRVNRLREFERQLDIELGVLSAPARIRDLASKLGMAPVPPDRIRVIAPLVPPAEAHQAHQPHQAEPTTLATRAHHADRGATP